MSKDVLISYVLVYSSIPRVGDKTNIFINLKISENKRCWIFISIYQLKLNTC